jgi:uncharacterized membrane protein YphA (DoxX/SURF4 family)
MNFESSLPPSQGSTASSAASLARFSPYLLSILRIIAALLFLEHGLAKFFGFPARTMAAPALFDLEWFAAAIEFGAAYC